MFENYSQDYHGMILPGFKALRNICLYLEFDDMGNRRRNKARGIGGIHGLAAGQWKGWWQRAPRPVSQRAGTRLEPLSCGRLVRVSLSTWRVSLQTAQAHSCQRRRQAGGEVPQGGGHVLMPVRLGRQVGRQVGRQAGKPAEGHISHSSLLAVLLLLAGPQQAGVTRERSEHSTRLVENCD